MSASGLASGMKKGRPSDLRERDRPVSERSFILAASESPGCRVTLDRAGEKKSMSCYLECERYGHGPESSKGTKKGREPHPDKG